MRNAQHMPNRPRLLAAVLLSAALAGCSYLVYIPMLILVPFMPLIQLAIKVAARYGPLLLMLAEADPTAAHYSPGLIAATPADPLRARALPPLEQSLIAEVLSNHNLRTVTLVEATALTPEWLDEQQRAAHARGLSLRIVFVDSRAPALSNTARQLCAEHHISLLGTPGLGALAAAGLPAPSSSNQLCSAAHASLIASTAVFF